ncbi:LmeA family phospholipid-binding protein [Nocardioides rubriscoriae]|uniref:LmeA family phospholipid-binding protein n=1 Tax=Nocardioides rubriscoriae TaxID=642762 RepID=UPI0014789890|nr:DUF2993 domain-containing protein [Nocardioides rubriscoriae]
MTVLALAGGEWGLHRLVEDHLAEGAACRLTDPTAELDLSIVTPHLVSGHLGDVRIGGSLGSDAPVGATLEARLDDVHVGLFGSGPRTASDGSARVTVGWANLPLDSFGGPLGGALRPGEQDGYLALEGPGLTLLAAVDVADGELRVTPDVLLTQGQEIQVSRFLPLIEQRSPEAATQLQPRSVPLPDLPDGVTLTGAEVSGTGLVLNADLDPTALLADSEACS